MKTMRAWLPLTGLASVFAQAPILPPQGRLPMPPPQQQQPQASAGTVQFEVESVKPKDRPPPRGPGGVPMRGRLGNSHPGRLFYPYSTLTALLMTAYGLKSYQVVGPEWLETDHYEVTAKVPGGATREQVNEMLRNLLAERFKMTVHTEQRETAVYNLVVARGGPKLTKSATDRTGGLGFRLYGARTTLIGKKMRVDGILGTLIREMERPVLDHTGLTDDYDITLDFANQRVRDMGRPASTG